MTTKKKGQFIGGTLGLLVGSIIAYLIWGFSPPGGIIILFCFAIGGLIGWNVGEKKEREKYHENENKEY